MARTDSNDPQKQERWRFKAWLDAVGNFFNGGSQSAVVSGGGVGPRSSAVTPPVVALARIRHSQQQNHEVGQLSRMEEAKRKNSIWNRDLRPLVIEALAEQFHPHNFQRMRLFPSTWTNAMRRIVEDISTLYEAHAIRRLVPNEGREQTVASAHDTTVGEGAVSDVPTPGPQDATPDAQGGPGSDDRGNGGTQDEADLASVMSELSLTGTEDSAGKVDPLEDLLELVDWDVTLSAVERHARIHEVVWVRPMVSYGEYVPVESDVASVVITDEGGPEMRGDPKTGKLHFIVYDPSNADIVHDPHNPNVALAWYYWGEMLMSNGFPKRIVHFYTKDQYWKLDTNWKAIEPPQVNPLGRLPVTAFRIDLPSPGSYYLQGNGRDLMTATIEACVLRTIQNNRYRDSGFKQVVLTSADEEGVPSDQVMGGPTPIYLPEGGSATVLDMQPELLQLTEVINNRADELAAAYGITAADYKANSTPRSGFAKKLDRARITKENRRVRKFFAEGEQDLYNNCAVTLNTYPIDSVPTLDPMAKFEVDFAETYFEEDPLVQTQQDAQDLKMNKKSIVDILQRLNPDLNQVELLQKAILNQKINALFITKPEQALIDVLAGPSSAGAVPAGKSSGSGSGGVIDSASSSLS